MCRPCRCGDEVAVRDRVADGDIRVNAAGEFDFRAASGIGRAGAALEDTGCGKELSAVADRRYRLAGLEEVPDGFDDIRVEAQILGRATARDHERVVIFSANTGEGC